MHKRRMIALPSVQLLVVLGAFAWFSVERSGDIWNDYAYVTRDIAVKLNFPVFAIWGPVALLIDRFGPLSAPSSAVISTIIVIVVAGIPAASILLFWYFFGLEVEMRLKNESLIRFKNWPAETCKVLVLFAAGIGSIVYAVLETNRLLYRNNTDAIIGGALLLAWGGLFITISIRDFAFFLRTRSHGPHGSAPQRSTF